MKIYSTFPVLVLFLMTPKTLIANDYIFTDQTTLLVNEFAQHIELPDYDNDGVLSDADFIVWMFEYVDMIEVTDINSDGVVDSMDATVVLTNVLTALVADYDKNGLVNLTDLFYVAANGSTVNPTVIEGDLNADSIVDDSDMAIVIVKMGDEVGLDPHSVASYFVQPDDAPPGYSPWFLPTHIEFISSQYPPTFIPPPPYPFPHNHDAGISNGWYPDPPPYDHSTIDSYNWWRGNHIRTFSQAWDWPPANHGNRISFYRRHWPSNHNEDISITYDNPVDVHAWVNSRLFPVNHVMLVSNSNDVHSEVYSQLVPPENWPGPFNFPTMPSSDHHVDISSTWDTHDQQLSAAIWPTNHIQGFSLSWPTGHAFHLSAAWPAGHLGSISSGWPSGYPNWPANHVTPDSSEWGLPEPVVPWFPANHSVLVTALQIIPLIDGESNP